MEDLKLISGEYYRINGTEKVLYWDGQKWMSPEKDSRGNFDGWVSHLEKQPKVKTAELLDIKTVFK